MIERFIDLGIWKFIDLRDLNSRFKNYNDVKKFFMDIVLRYHNLGLKCKYIGTI